MRGPTRRVRAARAEEEAEEDEEEDEEADEEQRTRWQHSRAKTGGLKLHWRKNQANKRSPDVASAHVRHHHWTLDASSQLRAKTWPTATASRTHARLHKEDTSWPACARTNHAVTPLCNGNGMV